MKLETYLWVIWSSFFLKPAQMILSNKLLEQFFDRIINDKFYSIMKTNSGEISDSPMWWICSFFCEISTNKILEQLSYVLIEIISTHCGKFSVEFLTYFWVINLFSFIYKITNIEISSIQLLFDVYIEASL